jgi:hypothetical protein
MATAQYDVILNFITKMNSSSKTSDNIVKKQTEQVTKAMSVMPKMIDKSIAPTVRLKQAFSEMIDLERFREMGGDITDYNKGMSKVQQTVKNLGGDFSTMSAQTKKMSKGFDMNMMSMMFFGMQIQKTFLGIQNQMLNTFKMLDKKGIMPLNRALTKMEAAFTFLSFAMMKAMEPVLLPIIDMVVGVIDWFSQLPEPVLQAVDAFILFGIALGTGMFLLGTLSLGMAGVEGFFIGLTKYVPAATKVLSEFGSLSVFGLIGSLAGTLIIVTAAWLVFTAALEGYSKHSEEVDNSLSAIDISFWNLIDTLTFGMLELPENQTLWDTFWSLLTTGATGAIIIISTAVSSLIDLIDILINTAALIPTIAIDLFSGKDLSKNESLGKISTDVERIFTTSNKAWNDLMKIGAEDSSELFDTTLSTKMSEINAKAPEFSADYIQQYSTGMDNNAVVLNDTTTKVFTESGDIMKQIVKDDVNTVIADVNRALAKLRELENARKAASTKATTSTTNNNKSIVVNVKGSDNTKLVSDVKKAIF